MEAYYERSFEESGYGGTQQYSSLQRLVYDPTRDFLLLGRDQLIEKMSRARGRALEIGCGNAKNLMALTRRNPLLELYGTDTSARLLEAANKKLQGPLLSRIELLQADPESLDYDNSFGLPEPFDYVFFSYSLSLMTNWRSAIDCALSNLKAEGTLLVLDFWSDKGLPPLLRPVVGKSLSWFQVKFEPRVLEYLRGLPAKGLGALSIEPVHNGYAYLAEYR
jgi:S-adenosylmethionine-diacylgycerolhomoserine-N-methlytransferase